MVNIIPRIEFLMQAMLGINRRTICPHCKSDHNVVCSKKWKFIKIKRCNSCHLFFTDPIYKSCISKNFYNVLYQGGPVTAIPSRKDIDYLKQDRFGAVHRNYDHILGLIRSTGGSGNLLEFGSSWGYFLSQAEKHGFRPTGIEIAQKRAAFGKKHLGVDIRADFSEVQDNYFDIIFTAHVLEHLTDISDIFKQFKVKCKPGGSLFIEVPMYDIDIFGHTRNNVMGAVHPLGFCVRFFEDNMPKYGFEIMGIYGSWEDMSKELRLSGRAEVICLHARKVISPL